MSAPVLPIKIMLDRKSAAFALSISPRSVDYLIADGRLQASRVGGRVLIAVSELQAFAQRDQTAYLVPKAA